MALKALICPQCGSPLQVEEESEFGECKHCNTTIKIQDIYKVYHKVDNREATDSRRIMGQRCFEVGRYIQAEQYYTQVLEVYPHDIEGMYRKGICSLMNSIGKSPDTAEYKLYMRETRNVIDHV